MRGRRRERLRVESRVHDTNLRSVGEQNRCQVGPTILFECPAQIPRSSLRSFSLWARHSAENSNGRSLHSGGVDTSHAATSWSENAGTPSAMEWGARDERRYKIQSMSR